MNICQWLRARHEIALAEKAIRASQKARRETRKALQKLEQSEQNLKNYISRTQGENEQERRR